MARDRQTKQSWNVSGVITRLVAALLLSFGMAAPVQAQLPSKLIVTVTASPNPAASAGQVTYAVIVKNDGSFKAKGVLVTIPIPATTQFVRCTARKDDGGAVPIEVLCSVAGGIVTVDFGNIRAHLEGRVNLTLLMPSVTSPTEIIVEAAADSSDATDDLNHVTSTVLPPGAFIAFLPSGRVAALACGSTLDAGAFGSDTTAQLTGDLGCTSEPFGLKVTAADKVLDLNTFKIFAAPPLIAGNVGILLGGAARLKIRGGSTGGTSGIEQFDWCVKDEGGSKKATIDTVRCFRARSAGFYTQSKGFRITNSLVDRVQGTATTTAELPGGVGIHTRGDNSSVNQTFIRRTTTVGLWLAGVDTNADGRVATVEGNQSTMRIEKSSGIGLLLEGGPHIVNPMYVEGDVGSVDPPTSTDGVVVDTTGIDNILKGLKVKKFVANGFVVDGMGTDISDADVEEIGSDDANGDFIPGDGFIIPGAGTVLSGNKVQQARRGYVVSGPDATLETNEAENLDSHGFVIEGNNATVKSNSAKGNLGTGYTFAGTGGLIDTNEAEDNGLDGFAITGHTYTVKTNKSKKSGLAGFSVSGTGNHFNSNSAESNDGPGWVIGPGNVDDGGNKTHGSTFSFTSAGGTFLD